MEDKVIVLLRTSSVARAPVYAHLCQLGLKLLVVHPFEPIKVFNGLFSWWLQCDTHDAGALAPVLRRFLEAHGLTDRVAAIVSFDEYAVYPAALLATRWGLPCVPLPPNELRRVNIKSDFRNWCHAHGVTAPRHVVLQKPVTASEEEGEEASEFTASIGSQLADLSFPIILKPSPGAGSLLARVCATVEEAADHARVMWRTLSGHPDEKHFAALRHSYASQAWSDVASPVPSPSSQMSPTASSSLASTSGSNHDVPPTTTTTLTSPVVDVLAEEYISGFEVDMDCAVEHGEIVFCAISDNRETKLPFCAEEGGMCPSALPEAAQLALRDLLDVFVVAHGASLHGVLHFEAKYDPVRQRAYVIEVNCRMGSAETHFMLTTAYRGLQLGEALVRCAMGLPLRPWVTRYYPEYKVHTHQDDDDGDGDQSASEHHHGLSASSTSSASSPQSEGPQLTSTPSSQSQSHRLTSTPAVLRCAGTLPCERLGGPARGFYPPCAVAASVNLYPDRAGTLRHVAAPIGDARLVACSVSAVPGEYVAPPPGRFYLLCWMVARGESVQEAIEGIEALTHAFEQQVDPDAPP